MGLLFPTIFGRFIDLETVSCLGFVTGSNFTHALDARDLLTDRRREGGGKREMDGRPFTMYGKKKSCQHQNSVLAAAFCLLAWVSCKAKEWQGLGHNKYIHYTQRQT